MARRSIRRIGKSGPSSKPQVVKVENPELWPAFVYLPGASPMERKLRGEAVFLSLREAGMLVHIGDGVTSSDVYLDTPVTFIYMSVPAEDATSWIGQIQGDYRGGVVIVDCHFPITRPEDWISTVDHERIVAAIPAMMTNMMCADAVTVPHPIWAADLAEQVPEINVFVLPDLVSNSPLVINQWLVKYMEICATARMKAAERWNAANEPDTGDDVSRLG